VIFLFQIFYFLELETYINLFLNSLVVFLFCIVIGMHYLPYCSANYNFLIHKPTSVSLSIVTVIGVVRVLWEGLREGGCAGGTLLHQQRRGHR